MSEYQYYEFLALDRPLTQVQISKLRGYSTRAKITSRSFVNEYQWGDFKGDPEQWMEKYFDAFLYYANWGSRWFMLRLPARLLDPKLVAAYCADQSLSCENKNDYVVLSFYTEIEDYEWEQDTELASLVPIRSDLMSGDYRALYLGWLLGVRCGDIAEGDVEPPVPPRLSELNPALEALAEFLGIDGDIISAAAEGDTGQQTANPSSRDIHEWIRALPSGDKDEIIAKLIDGDNSHVSAELRQRALRELGGGLRSRKPARTAGEILSRANVLAGERLKKETKRRALEQARREKEQAEERKRYLEALAGREKQLWSRVENLIATKQSRRYDQAVSWIRDLRDLADMLGTVSEFKARMDALRRENSSKSALIERLRSANLLR